jgi:hypothetical protein
MAVYALPPAVEAAQDLGADALQAGNGSMAVLAFPPVGEAARDQGADAVPANNGSMVAAPGMAVQEQSLPKPAPPRVWTGRAEAADPSVLDSGASGPAEAARADGDKGEEEVIDVETAPVHFRKLPPADPLTPPEGGVVLTYLASRTVVYRHATHNFYDCDQCHHDRKDQGGSCALQGCHVPTFTDDPNPLSLFQAFHYRPPQGEKPVRTSCLSCHHEKSVRLEGIQANKARGCSRSYCHP